MSLASSSDRKRELPSPRDGPPRWRSQAQASLACSLMLGLNNRGALSTPKGQCLRPSCRSSSLPKHARAFDAPPSASRTVVGPTPHALPSSMRLNSILIPAIAVSLAVTSTSARIDKKALEPKIDCATADRIFLKTGVKVDCVRPNPATETVTIPYCTGPVPTPFVTITSYVTAVCSTPGPGPTNPPISTSPVSISSSPVSQSSAPVPSASGCPVPTNNCPGAVENSSFEAKIITDAFE